MAVPSASRSLRLQHAALQHARCRSQQSRADAAGLVRTCMHTSMRNAENSRVRPECMHVKHRSRSSKLGRPRAQDHIRCSVLETCMAS